MKVTVFGGCGDMGKSATRDLANNPDVNELIIADYNIKKATALAEELNPPSSPFNKGGNPPCIPPLAKGGDGGFSPLEKGGLREDLQGERRLKPAATNNLGGNKKITAEFVDANNTSQVVDLMKGNDVCLSCIGPFYKFEEKMVRCAITAKVNYVSICDDYDAVEKILPLNEEVKSTGILVLTGMGWTPGLSNVLARKGINSLQKTEKINIAWEGDAFDSEGLAVVKHTLHIFTGKIKTFIDGKLREIDAGTDEEKVEFLPPIRKIPVYNVGHPEPVTFAHFFPQLKEVTLKGGLKPVFLNGLAIFLAKNGFVNTREQIDRVSKIIYYISKVVSIPTKGLYKGISGLRIDVYGENDKGAKEKITYLAVDNMWRLTGFPAAIACWMIGAGKVQVKGIVAPEICIDPDELLSQLEKRGVVTVTYVQGM